MNENKINVVLPPEVLARAVTYDASYAACDQCSTKSLSWVAPARGTIGTPPARLCEEGHPVTPLRSSFSCRSWLSSG